MSSAFQLKDAEWVRQAFLVTTNKLASIDVQNRTFSSVVLKYVDTTPGGNLAINPPPQFTRTADIRNVGMYSGNANGASGTFVGGVGGVGSSGMGRYYSEAIDDNAQRIYMRFGVPRFNSLTTFFSSFYDASAGELARTGRAGGFFYSIGLVVGFVVSILSWKLVAIHLAGMALRFFTSSPGSKFYYLKPTMPVYWTAVTTIVNQLAVNRGIVPRIGGADQQSMNNQYTFSTDALAQLHNLLPDIFKEGGGVDVYAMANRAQRLAYIRNQQMQKMMDIDGKLDITNAVKEIMNTPISDNRPNYTDYMKRWYGVTTTTPANSPTNSTAPPANSDNSTLAQGTAGAAGNKDAGPVTGGSGDASEVVNADSDETKSGFMDFFRAELGDGSAFATFRVNATGHISESFSNSVTESELASKINGMSSSSRSTRFDLADGNVSDGIVGKAIGGIMEGAKDVLKGVADSVGMSGLAALAGSAFVDIPKHWQSSSASLPRSSYSISLVSPYGNPISQMLNLDIPLAMLLAAALPLSTGKQSYTSPFICELYDQGRCQTRLGMVDSLSITRGTSNLGFNNDAHAMAIDVSFSIVDMSSIMSMPINQGFSTAGAQFGATAGGIIGGAAGAVSGGPGGAVVGAAGGATAGAAGGAVVDAAGNAIKTINGIFDDDNVFTDYMAVLAGMTLQDQIYQWRKFKLNITRAMQTWGSFYSASHFAGVVGDIPPARLISALYKARSSGSLSSRSTVNNGVYPGPR